MRMTNTIQINLSNTETPLVDALEKELYETQPDAWTVERARRGLARDLERKLNEANERIAIMQSDQKRLEGFAALYRRQVSELEQKLDALT